MLAVGSFPFTMPRTTNVSAKLREIFGARRRSSRKVHRGACSNSVWHTFDDDGNVSVPFVQRQRRLRGRIAVISCISETSLAFFPRQREYKFWENTSSCEVCDERHSQSNFATIVSESRVSPSKKEAPLSGTKGDGLRYYSRSNMYNCEHEAFEFYLVLMYVKA